MTTAPPFNDRETRTLSVLLVEDDPQDVRLVTRMFSDERPTGYSLQCVSSIGAALQAGLVHPPDVVLLDLNLPDSDGLDSLARLVNARAPVVVLTGLDSPDILARARRFGAFAVFVKGSFRGIELRYTTRLAARLRGLATGSAVSRRGPERTQRPILRPVGLEEKVLAGLQPVYEAWLRTTPERFRDEDLAALVRELVRARAGALDTVQLHLRARFAQLAIDHDLGEEAVERDSSLLAQLFASLVNGYVSELRAPTA